MDRGIAYTNEEFVIVFCDDLLEKRFTAIFYRIQKDLNIPFDTENYFTLVAFLHGKGDSVGANKVSDYTSFLDLNDCIRKTSYYVGEYISELLAT